MIANKIFVYLGNHIHENNRKDAAYKIGRKVGPRVAKCSLTSSQPAQVVRVVDCTLFALKKLEQSWKLLNRNDLLKGL